MNALKVFCRRQEMATCISPKTRTISSSDDSQATYVAEQTESKEVRYDFPSPGRC